MSHFQDQIEMHKARAVKLAGECAQHLRALALANHRIAELQKEIAQLRSMLEVADARINKMVGEKNENR